MLYIEGIKTINIIKTISSKNKKNPSEMEEIDLVYRATGHPAQGRRPTLLRW